MDNPVGKRQPELFEAERPPSAAAGRAAVRDTAMTAQGPGTPSVTVEPAWPGRFRIRR